MDGIEPTTQSRAEREKEREIGVEEEEGGRDKCDERRR